MYVYICKNIHVTGESVGSYIMNFMDMDVYFNYLSTLLYHNYNGNYSFRDFVRVVCIYMIQ